MALCLKEGNAAWLSAKFYPFIFSLYSCSCFFSTGTYVFCILTQNTYSVKGGVLLVCFTMWGKQYLRCFIYNHCFLKVTCGLRFEAWLSNDVLMGRVVLLESFYSVAEQFRKDACLRSLLGGKDGLGTRTRTFKVKSPIHTSSKLLQAKIKMHLVPI